MKKDVCDLATKINALMLQKGITRKELATEIGVSPQFFIHIANGRMPAADKFCALANALGVSAEWLLFGQDVNMPSWTIDLATICSNFDDADKEAVIAFAEFYQEQKKKNQNVLQMRELDLIIAFSEFLKNRKSGGSRRFGVVIQRYQERLQKLRTEHSQNKADENMYEKPK